MNWLLIIVGVIILIGALNGFAKGAVRILVSLVTTVLTIVIVYFASPYVSQSIMALTPVDDIIERQCLKTIENMWGDDESEEEVPETEEEKIDIYDSELSRNSQIAIIESAELPDAMKDLLLCNNNSEVYELLGVTTFVEYIIKYLTKIIVDILAFLITFIVVTIVIRAIVFALDFVTELPVLGILNRLSGVLVGSSLSLIIVWFIFIIITLIYTTEIGKTLMQMIAEDKYLLALYEMNPILKMMTMLR